MAAPIISVNAISKQFSTSDRSGAGAWWRVLTGKPVPHGHQVLDDVSFNVNCGDSIAILGENGAGKSTLLKIIAGILQPDSGVVRKTARIGAMLELGAGFDDQLTGQENVIAACQMAGLSAEQAVARLPDVAQFANLGPALAEPVGHYSSGMVVRLGFAVMTVTCPDVLISDEVLAVGDESFQKKCIAWVESYLADGGTLLLVSHSLYHVQRLCSQAIWLHDGRVRCAGDVFSVSQDYLAYHEKKLDHSTQHPSDDDVRIRQLNLILPEENNWSDAMIQVSARLDGAPIAGDGTLVWQLGRLDGAAVGAGKLPLTDSSEWTIELPGDWLPGNLRLDVWPANARGERCGRAVRRMIRITGRAREFGILRLPHRWVSSD